jgi:hypothetical protein
MVRLPPRLVGLALLAASGGTTLVHRTIYEAARHDAARLAELAIGLLTFLLASAGMLMLIHGARLFEGRPCGEAAKPASARDASVDPLGSAADACDTRRGVALLQARGAIGAARRRTSREPERIAGADCTIPRRQ